jgi:hypothetical protein
MRYRGVVVALALVLALGACKDDKGASSDNSSRRTASAAVQKQMARWAAQNRQGEWRSAFRVTRRDGSQYANVGRR